MKKAKILKDFLIEFYKVVGYFWVPAECQEALVTQIVKVIVGVGFLRGIVVMRRVEEEEEDMDRHFTKLTKEIRSHFYNYF